MWMKRWSNSTRAGHAAIPDSRRPDIRIGRGSLDCHRASAILRDGLTTVEKADPSLAQQRIDFDLWLSRNPEPSSWEERQYGFIPD